MPLYLCVKPEPSEFQSRGSHYFHVNAVPVRWESTVVGEPEWPRWSPFSGTEQAFANLDGLTVSSQLDEASRLFYAMRVSYEARDIDEARATAIAKTLRKVTKRMDAIQDREGYAQDIASYLRRVADGLGATQAHAFIVYPLDHKLWHDGSRYRTVTVDGLRYHINDAVKAWRTKYGIELPEEANA